MGARPRFADSEQVGPYTLFSEIASGAMGAVHFGRLHGEGGFARTVVIKRMHRAMLGDADLVDMFVDEARTAARVRHPNVVQTLDVVATEREVFVVMDYVDGESLAGMLAARPNVPPRIAASIVAGFLRGLHAAHEAVDEHGESLELVHRDVTPANILVGVDGAARILDFGIAKATGRLHVTREGKVKGKLAYMPPEQLYGEALDRRTDIYAAGVVLWEVLTGRRLFAQPTERETVDRILHAPTPPPGDLNADLRPFDAIVLRALARNPDDRFETAQEMAVSLETSVPCATPSEVGAWVESVAAPSLAERARTLAIIEAASAPNGASATRSRRSAKLVVASACAAGALALIVSSAVRGGSEVRSSETARTSEVVTASLADPTSRAPAVPALVAAPARSSELPVVDAGARVRRSSSQARADDCSMPYTIDREGRKHYNPACLR